MADSQDLAQRRSRLTPAQRALLQKRLSGGPAAGGAGGEGEGWRITPRDNRGPAPLSYGESRLWHFVRQRPRSAAFNVYHAVSFMGLLNLAALAASLRAVIARHEVLWSHFSLEDGEPAAQPDPALLPTVLPVIDLSALSQGDQATEALRVVAELAAPGFESGQGPLLRTALVHTAAVEHALFFALHHLVTDGWSLGLLVAELATVYGELAAGRPLPALRPPLQAADFAVWQRRRIAEGALDADLAWWREHLAGASPEPFAWPARPGAPAGSHGRMLGEGLAEALKALAQRERVTLFVALLAGLQVLLWSETGGAEVIIGTPVALRGGPEAAGISGFLLNLLPLRLGLAGDLAFGELLRRARDVFLGAFTHREAPVEWLARELLPSHDPGSAPWITVLFNMPLGGAGHAEPLRAGGVDFEPILTGETGFELDLTFYAREVPGGIRLDLSYNANVLAPGEPERLLEGLAALLEGAAAHPERRLSELVGGVVAPLAVKGN
ncbi:MAG TPA: condensation domain-containing protein [Thermoanaerobaculia bacterium]|nr:condensation domain-containing protein [Thermoanaerobaculia bacterium]